MGGEQSHIENPEEIKKQKQSQENLNKRLRAELDSAITRIERMEERCVQLETYITQREQDRIEQLKKETEFLQHTNDKLLLLNNGQKQIADKTDITMGIVKDVLKKNNKRCRVVGNDVQAGNLHFCEHCLTNWPLDPFPENNIFYQDKRPIGQCHGCNRPVVKFVNREDMGPTSYCEGCGDTVMMNKTVEIVKGRSLNRYTCPTCHEEAEQLIDPKEMET